MKLLIIIICTIIVIFMTYFKFSDKIKTKLTESFDNINPYLIYNYVPSVLEKNPLTCYISSAESYVDKTFFEKLSLEIPLKITSDANMKFHSDLAILPEITVLKNSSAANVYKYDFLSHLKDMSFFLVQINNVNIPILNFVDIRDKHVYIKKGGYVSTLFDEIFQYLKILPKITYYNEENEAIDALKNNSCDAIACLIENPSVFLFELSYKYSIKIIPWNLNSVKYDILGYYLRGLKNTKISLAYYKYSELKTELESVGFTKDLFINKNLPNNIVEKITKLIFKPKGILRSNAVKGSLYINFHQGTNTWLKKQGLLSITNHSEHPSCVLLAGNSSCTGDNAKYAKHVYEKDFWGSQIPNDQTMLSFLKKTHLNKEDPNHSHKYNKMLESSHICFDQVKIKDKGTCEKLNMTWDSPCLFNTDCPFFQANLNYPNDFGGCNRGFCEMPLGIQRKGFKKYESKPLCHNCPFENPFCCDQTKLMASQDIAFTNDRLTRIKHKKELNLRKIVV